MLCVSQMSAVFVWQPVRGFPFSCSNVICYHRILREFAFLYAPSSVQQRLHRDICLLSVNIKSKLGSFTFKMCVSDFTVWDSSAHVFGQKKKLHNLSSKCNSLPHPTNNFPFWHHISSADKWLIYLFHNPNNSRWMKSSPHPPTHISHIG